MLKIEWRSLRIRLTSEVRKRNATPREAKIVPTQSEALNRRQPGPLDLPNLHLAKSARVGVLDRLMLAPHQGTEDAFL